MITHLDNGETELEELVIDQTALPGMLNQIRGLGQRKCRFKQIAHLALQRACQCGVLHRRGRGWHWEWYAQ